MLFIVLFLLFSLHLFLLIDFSLYSFTLPGDNPARIAALFLFFAFCGLNTFSLFKSVTIKLFIGSLTILCVLIAIRSSSRSAIVVFLLISFFYLLFQIIQNKDRFQRLSFIYFLSVIVLFCCLVWFLAIPKNAKDKISSAIQIPGQIIAYIHNKDQESYKNILRLPIWNNAITKFKEYPLFGAGYGSQYNNEILNIKFVHPHSVFFQFMAETGIIGLGTFILFITFVFKKAINDYRSLIAKKDKLTYLFYPLSFVFFLLFSCFHFAIHENYFFWYFAGIITGFETNGNVRL
jgi:O-antigen ligase